MTGTDIRHIVIVGDAATGSMTAAAMAISLRGSNVALSLVHRPQTDTAPGAFSCRGGDGSLHSLLGINEDNLRADTGAVPSLGASYRGFVGDAAECLVPLGGHGMTLRLVDFHHYATKLRSEGDNTAFNAYSYQAAAIARGHFEPGSNTANTIDEYDLVFDAARYAHFMLEHARRLGVATVAAQVQSITGDADGYVESVVLDNGDSLAGDFFIDCSSDRCVRGAMDEAGGFVDWSGSLPAVSVATTLREEPLRPPLCVDIAASDDGWTQTLGMQDVRFETLVCDDAATTAGTATTRISSGTLDAHWCRNCVAIGPAATTVPPLDVSAMHLAQDGLRELLGMLPRHRNSVALADEYNRIATARAASVRDYLTLRFALATRSSGAFWQHIGEIDIPASLQQRIDLFRCHGRFTVRDHDLFSKSNWVSSFINFGAWPDAYDPLADMIDEARMRTDLRQLRDVVAKAAAG